MEKKKVIHIYNILILISNLSKNGKKKSYSYKFIIPNEIKEDIILDKSYFVVSWE